MMNLVRRTAMRTRLLGVVLLWTAACATGPKYQIDDSALAAVPLEEKSAVLAAQNELNQARAEQDHARANLSAAKTRYEMARNESKAAQLELENAKLRQKANQASGDLNRTGSSEHEMKLAELKVNTARAKLEWLDKKRRWLDETADAADAHVAAAEAKYELEKARVADARKIKPSENFNLPSFESTNLDKQKRYVDARMGAEKMKAEVDRAERTYQSQQSLLDRVK